MRTIARVAGSFHKTHVKLWHFAAQCFLSKCFAAREKANIIGANRISFCVRLKKLYNISENIHKGYKDIKRNR
jgi:hypothetical protein